jgi:hypothetical protein
LLNLGKEGVDGRHQRGHDGAGVIRSHRNSLQTDAETTIGHPQSDLRNKPAFSIFSQLAEKAELLRAGCRRYRSTPSRISKEYLFACKLVYVACRRTAVILRSSPSRNLTIRGCAKCRPPASAAI